MTGLATAADAALRCQMMMFRRLWALFSLCVLAATASVQAEPASLFDPARHMRVSEVHPGMKGYGLSVFFGTKIERFDVEVISVLKNFNPKSDVVLIKFSGDNLEHNLAIAGMSGSPIYLYDDSGKARMIGAFAYGWQLQKDPIAGVQPIEYMLKLPETAVAPASQPSEGNRSLEPLPLGHGKVSDKSVRPVSFRGARWSLSDSVLLPGMKSPPASYPLAEWGKMTPNPKMFSAGDDASRLRPLATPLMIGGMSPRVLSEMEPLFRAYGLMPMQAGGGGSGDDSQVVPIEPGCVLGVPLVEGDVDMSAIGTCTEIVGTHVLAFGHSFNSEGRVSLPLAGGSIQGIVANLSSSFKLGALTKVRGTLRNDQTVGIAGELGVGPVSVPVDLRVKYTDGSEDQTYHFTTALHPKMTPMLVAAAMSSAITGAKEMPENHTVDYDLTLEFENGKTIHVVNSSVNISASDLFYEVGTPLTAAAENPFEPVMVKKITGTMVVSPTANEGQILYANVPRSRYRPGETVTAYVTYRPFRAGEMMMPVSMELPKDLPDGTYQLTISDWQKFFADERTAEPFKFTAETIDQVFDVLQDAASIRHEAVYLRLIRQPDGVSIGHTAMAKLPSSRRQILIGAGRSDTTQFVSSAVKVVPTDRVMSGTADFEITIDKNAEAQKVK
jgi:hypothetical protein